MKRFICLIILLIIFNSCQESKNKNRELYSEAYFRSNTVLKFSSSEAFRLPDWQFQSGGPIHSTAVIAGPRVYVGSDDGFLYALDNETGSLDWKFNSQKAIFSSPAISGNTVFVSNEDSLFALDLNDGAVKWRYGFEPNQPYPWKFDRFLSSPVPAGETLYVGSSDGNLHALDITTGEVKWKFKSEEYIRCTPAINSGMVLFGDTKGKFYGIDATNGSLKWEKELDGYKTSKEASGNDLQSIISSPVVSEGTVFFGSRDSNLYALDIKTGEVRWKLHHGGTWIIGSPVIEHGTLYVGTADQQYLQAVDINTGEEKWRCKLRGMVWSSPLIVGPYIYVGTSDGFLYCIDKAQGKVITNFTADAGIFSSPVASEQNLFIGADNGMLYTLNPVEIIQGAKKVVYWQDDKNYKYFKNQVDVYNRDYFKNQGYTEVDNAGLSMFLSHELDTVVNSIVVLATNAMPQEVISGESGSLLSKYLHKGGKIVAFGTNPLVYLFNDEGVPYAFDFVDQPDSILGVRYFENDYRSFSGFQGAYPTSIGQKLGMSSFVMAACPIDPELVTEVYAIDRDGLAVSWLKSYGHEHKGFTQLWLNRSYVESPAMVQTIAEYGITWKFKTD